MTSGLRDTTLAIDRLLNEIQHADPTLAANLQETLKSLPSNPAMLN